MVRFLRFGRSLVSRQSRNPSGCRLCPANCAKQTGRMARGLAPKRRPIQIRGEKSSADGQLFQEFAPEFGERVVAGAEDEDAVACLGLVEYRGAAIGTGGQMDRICAARDDVGDERLTADAAVDGAAEINGV